MRRQTSPQFAIGHVGRQPFDVSDLIQRSKDLGLDRSPQYMAILNHACADPSDHEAIEFVLGILQAKELENLANPNAFRAIAPTELDDVDGQLVIGQTEAGTIYGINPDALCRHLLVGGSSGSGKTLTALLLVSQVLCSCTPAKLVIICRKRDYRSLQRISKDLVVIPWQFYRDNPFRNTPGVNLRAWQNVAAQIIGSLDLRYPSKSLLLEALHLCCDKIGFSGGKDQPCPTLSDVERALRKDMKIPKYGRQADYRDSLENRLKGIRHHTGQVFDCDPGIDSDRLRKTNVVIETDGMAPEMRECLVNLCTLRIFMDSMSRGDRTPHLRTLLVMDEAQQVFRRIDEQQPGTPSLLGEMISQAREFGLGVVAGAQSVRDLANCLTANTAHKILCGVSDLRDLDEFCRMV